MVPHRLNIIAVVCLWMNCSAISDTMAKSILISQRICGLKGGKVQIICEWNGATTGTELFFWRRVEGTYFKIEPTMNDSKFRITKNATEHGTSDNGHSYTHKRKDLEIRDVSFDDGGIYGCGTELSDIRETNITILQDAEFRLAVILTNLSIPMEIRPSAGCKLEGTIRVNKFDSNGMTTSVGYGDGQERRPYIRSTDGAVIFPEFMCEDVGNYSFTYTTHHDLRPVDTKKTVEIQVATCTKDTVSIIEGSTPPSSTSKEEKQKHQEPGHVVTCDGHVVTCDVHWVIIGILILMVVVLLIIIIKSNRNRMPSMGLHRASSDL